MSLTHLKIGTRLGIGFGIVLVLLVATVALGLSAMRHIGDRTHDIIADKNVKMEAANKMVDNVRGITLALTNIVVVPGTPQMNAELARIAEARKRYGDARKILVDMATEDKEKSLLARLDDLLKKGAIEY